MKGLVKSCVVMAAVAAGMMLLAGPAGADEVPRVVGAEIVGGPVTAVRVDVDIRDLPPVEEWQKGDPIKEIPRRFYPHPAVAESPYQALPDRLADLQAGYNLESNRAFGTPIVNVAGQGNTGVSPPDTVGDVGPNHYIQAINHSNGSAVRVYDKNGTALAAAFYMDSLGSGSCTNGMGDPIILYDRQADRWFMQEFSSSGNYMCVYISQTPNPVSGGWYHYAFAAPSFPDYPHFGVWNNVYVATSNEGNPVPMYAWDRANMLTGATARAVQRFSVPEMAGYGFQALTPATLVGPNAPPAGMPALLMRHYDDEAHDGGSANPNADKLQLWELAVNWTTPASSTLTGPYNIAITEYNSKFIDYSTFYSVPTPGGGKLDPIREVILNRLQYTNFGDHQCLVGVLPTNLASGTAVNAAQRWFEVRGSQGSWSLFQEGTMSAGSTTQNRFTGSIAMDQSGNIALAYSYTDTATATSTPPSINYTGRLVNDTPNVMTQAETRTITGTGSISSSQRWGDYSAMGLDPADDCTFWYTTEYWTGSWVTRINSFKFDACGCALSINPLSISAATNGNNVIRVSWTDSTTPQISEYRVYRSLTAGSGFSLLQTVADSSPGSSSGAPYNFDDNTVSGGVTYYYKVYASDGAACVSAASNEASATATGSCALAPTFAGVAAVDNPGEATCALDLSWSAGASQCGNSLTYDVYRSTSSGFTPGAGNLVASGVSGTTYHDADNVPYNTPVYYVVRAKDSGNGVSDANLVEEGAIATGVITTSTWTDTLESYATLADAVLAGWSHAAATGTDNWALASGGDHTTGSGKSFSAAQPSTTNDEYMVSPEIGVIATTQLTFWHKYGFEGSSTFYDGGVLEVSTNGGSSWSDLGASATGGGYGGSLSTCCSNPLGGRQAWVGTVSAWTQVTVPLAAYNGQSVMLRWRMGNDSSVAGSAPWMIDDVVVTDAGVAGACTPGAAATPIFSDGFESGNDSLWSPATP